MEKIDVTEMVKNDEKERIEPIPAYLVDNRVIIWDYQLGSYIYTLGYFGKPVGIRKPKSPRFNRPLELSLLEALHLKEIKKIILISGSTEISTEEFLLFCQKNFPNFNDLYIVYSDLRSKRYIVRPGLKFGTEFSVYRQGPGIDHAPFLVSIFPQKSKLEPIDLVRAGRLATSVRKRYVIATVLSDNRVKYYVFQWFKP